jgi:hypothetical protein
MEMRTEHLSSLIQRHDNAELPAVGHWMLHRASFVGLTDRTATFRPSVSDGSLRVTEEPTMSRLDIRAGLGDRRIQISASPARVAADNHGFSRWELVGTVDDGIARHEVELTLSYRGVRRRGDRAWAWFLGQGRSIATSRRWLRRRAVLHVVLDLLFVAPSGAIGADVNSSWTAPRLVAAS